MSILESMKENFIWKVKQHTQKKKREEMLGRLKEGKNHGKPAYSSGSYAAKGGLGAAQPPNPFAQYSNNILAQSQQQLSYQQVIQQQNALRNIAQYQLYGPNNIYRAYQPYGSSPGFQQGIAGIQKGEGDQGES